MQGYLGNGDIDTVLIFEHRRKLTEYAAAGKGGLSG